MEPDILESQAQDELSKLDFGLAYTAIAVLLAAIAFVIGAIFTG